MKKIRLLYPLLLMTLVLSAKGNNSNTYANQCPIEGGSAVYQARAILALQGVIQDYDDQALCGRVKAFQRPPTSGGKTAPVYKTLQVYPNPTRDVVMVKWTISDFQKGHLVINDLFGRQLLTRVLESGSNTIELDLSALSSGVYFIQVKLDDQTPMAHKVVISK